MKVTIESVENGYVIRTNSEGEKTALVVQEDERGTADTAAALYWALVDIFGHWGSKHDARRLYITVEPGTDHPDYATKNIE